jgi:hypothetical protein
LRLGINHNPEVLQQITQHKWHDGFYLQEYVHKLLIYIEEILESFCLHLISSTAIQRTMILPHFEKQTDPENHLRCLREWHKKDHL